MVSTEDRATVSDGNPLRVRALARESALAAQFLAADRWRPTVADTVAATRTLARVGAPLPTRRVGAARQRTEDRNRRLQRIWRTAVHHLDAGAVSPAMAALLAAVARAFLPWYAVPTPPPAAAAPRYPMPDGLAHPPSEAGEALLPDLTSLFARLEATNSTGTASLTPPVLPWEIQYGGRFRRYGRPSCDVWTADTVRCSRCARSDGPWKVACDWRLVTLGCPCGLVTDRHGLAFSEAFLVLPDM
ncbi:hypothetical protein [Streptomyces sp. NPDC054854]